MKLLNKTKEIFEAWAISFNPDDAQAELASQRIEICDVCEHKGLEPYIHCNQCGCALKAKIYTPRTYKDSGGSCPKNKWKDVEDIYLKTKDVDTYNKLKSNKEDMEHNLLKRHAIEYFKKFRDKDLEALSNLYADNITLEDWTGKWEGKEAVLDMNADFFKSNFTIKIISVSTTKSVVASHTYVLFELIIGETTLTINDAILFNDDYKIISITAYLKNNGTT
jgi:ketosteroid isomerase-like protein